jgi:hypothetical protein
MEIPAAPAPIMQRSAWNEVELSIDRESIIILLETSGQELQCGFSDSTQRSVRWCKAKRTGVTRPLEPVSERIHGRSESFSYHAAKGFVLRCRVRGAGEGFRQATLAKMAGGKMESTPRRWPSQRRPSLAPFRQPSGHFPFPR